MFQIEMDNINLIEGMSKASEIMDKETAEWITTMAGWMKRDLQGRVPVKTGNLQRSIDYELNLAANGGKATFYASAKRDKWFYGTILDAGSKPHVIQAKNGKTLAFEKNGEKLFRSTINHPGSKPLNFTIQTVEVAEKEADRMAERIADRIWAVIG